MTDTISILTFFWFVCFQARIQIAKTTIVGPRSIVLLSKAHDLMTAYVFSWMAELMLTTETGKIMTRQIVDRIRYDLMHFRFGYSPLHLAALNEYSYCANMLLAYGADITARTNGGTSALAMIVRKIPNVLPKFEDMLDHAITLAEHDINDVDCELKLDFKAKIP